MHDYSQPQPSLRPILCACRFAVAEVNVPIRYQSETETRIPISVVQIAVASYMQAGSKVPSAILKGFLAPGVLPSWGNVCITFQAIFYLLGLTCVALLLTGAVLQEC